MQLFSAYSSCARYIQGIVQKDRLLQHVMRWRARLQEGEGVLPQCEPQWTSEIEQWLSAIRLDGVNLTTSGIYTYTVESL